MNQLTKAFSLLIFLFIVACNEQSNKPEVITTTPANSMEQNESAINIDISKLANSKDPICGMSLKGDLGDTATYNGKLYGFCSTDCKQEFLKNPSEYLK